MAGRANSTTQTRGRNEEISKTYGKWSSCADAIMNNTSYAIPPSFLGYYHT